MLRPHLVAQPNWLKLELSERTSPETLPFSTKSKELLWLESSIKTQPEELSSLEPSLPEPSETDSASTKRPSKFSRSKKDKRTSHSETTDLEHDSMII
jgi:hypothetical protein